MEKQLVSLSDLTDEQIRENLFRSSNCLPCGGRKSKKKSACRNCYYKLPPELRNRLYDPVFQGYEEAFRKAFEFLRS